MSAERLTIISTRLPPAACGIGTYSQLLHRYWPDKSCAVEFLVMEGAGPDVTAFAGRGELLEKELNRIGPSDLLLHYAGRAYQRFGCPTWLPGVIAKWKQKFPGSRVAIFFHELPGSFPITSRHFWLGRMQARIVRRLAHDADVIMTNTSEHVRQLREISGRNEIELFPVSSNIEPLPNPRTSRARSEFLIFGLPFGRWQTLQLFAPRLREWQAAGLLTKLHLIGPDAAEYSRRASELVEEKLLVRHGMLPANQVSALLYRVGFALTNASEKTWSKSTAFMAAAAHACPVVLADRPGNSAPLSHAVGAGEVATISGDELATRAAALAAWYRASADWAVVAQRMAALL